MQPKNSNVNLSPVFTTSILALLVSLLFALPSSLQAQCSGEVVLTSQAQVDAFNCTTVDGNLTIKGGGISNLNSLSGLTTVTGNLYIGIDAALSINITSLQGLESLRSVGGNFTLRAPELLTDIDHLDNLTSIGGDLYIYYVIKITNLNGLANLTSAGGIDLEYNYLLTDISGLSGINTSVGNLSIIGNRVLPNLDGLNGIPSVTGSLRIQGNDVLTDIDGLSGIGSVSQNLTVQNNSILPNLNGLSNITALGGDLRIDYNDQLTNTDGLLGITSGSSSQQIYISGNAALTNIDGLANLTTIGGIRIEGSSLASLDGLASLQSLTGTVNRNTCLSINNNDALTNVNGLSSLTSIAVGTNLSFSYNSALTEYCGLYPLFSGSSATFGFVFSNAVDPTVANILAGGPCPAPCTIGVTATVTDESCAGTSDGAIALSLSGSYGNASFAWSGPNGFSATTADLSGLLAGSYTVVATGYSSLGCSTTETFVVGDGGPCIPDPLVLISQLVANGSITGGNSTALTVKLNSCNLIAFDNQVNAFVNAGKITQAEADDLIAGAAAMCGASSRFAAPDAAFDLGQNYPNPTAGYTMIPFTLSASGHVRLSLYDATGKVVNTLLNETLEMGTHKVKANLTNLPAGLYFYRLEAGGEMQTLPLVRE